MKNKLWDAEVLVLVSVQVEAKDREEAQEKAKQAAKEQFYNVNFLIDRLAEVELEDDKQ